MIQVLVIDDDPGIREGLEMFFVGNGMLVQCAENAAAGLQRLDALQPALVVLDIRLPDDDGLHVLEEIRKRRPGTVVVMVTGFDEMNYTIKAMQGGAFDYLEKPFDLRRLQSIVDRAKEYLLNSSAVEAHLQADAANESRSRIVGNAPAIKEIFKEIGQVSTNRVTVLISGESGTGKELVARVIHDSGVTAGKPFVAFNCTAIPEGLLESELFGHVRGSFTDAVHDHRGRFALAGDGTIFLDEITELSLPMQAKLLRVLQERSFEPVGSEHSVAMSARVIAASNRDLWQAVTEKRFREDLYYRLNVCRIHVPPLRERLDDIPFLVMHFVRKLNEELCKSVVKVPYGVIERLKTYDWPGNIRELENTVMQGLIAAQGDVLELDPARLRPRAAPAAIAPPPEEEARLSLRDVERRHIALVLSSVKWEKKTAAAILGISRPTLNAKIGEYGIHPPKST
jgi:DNA-binding NtrC family response regulator